MHQVSIFVKFFSHTLFYNISEIIIPIAQICNRSFGSYALFYCYECSGTTCISEIISLISYEFKNHFLIDAALLYQARRVNIAFQEQGFDPDINYGEQQPGGAIYDNTKLFNGLSLNVVAGYKLWRGLKAGIGVEPTVYFNTKAKANLEDNKFDIPLVVKVGYDFNWFQVDLSYKNGFKRIYWNHVVGNTETRDLQLSIFVPIFK